MPDIVIVDDFPLPPVYSDNYLTFRAIFQFIEDHPEECPHRPCYIMSKSMKVPAGGKVRRFGESVPPMRKRISR